MGKAAEEFGCKFRRAQTPGQENCFLAGDGLKEYPGGCPSCVSLPAVEELLSQEMQDMQRGRLGEIREALKQGRSTLALGAGVSIPAGMPNWLGLISQMSGYALQYLDYTGGAPEGSRDLRVRLERELIGGQLKLFNGVNVLESGQYIERTLQIAAQSASFQAPGVQELMKETLSAIIERSKTPQQWRDAHPGLDPEGDPLAAARDNTLCAVAYLLCAKGGFRRALTYNYDTLVQEYMIGVFGTDPKRVLTHPGERSTYPSAGTADPIEIFHVHGCIPRLANRREPNCAFPKESEQVILSENSYYNTERFGAYNWQNSVQAYYLNQDSCVFVGFSADDYNFRRILRQMEKGRKRNGPKHYLILTIDELARDTWAAACRRSLSSSASSGQIREEALALLQMQLEMKRQYWESYDFYPIWVTIPDIPQCLLSLV